MTLTDQQPGGRVLTCARCGTACLVYDLNGAVVAGERFVGGCCLVPVRVPLNVSPAAAPCPTCGTSSSSNMQWQWKPDGEPVKERLRCHGCGWDTGWVAYGTCRAVAA